MAQHAAFGTRKVRAFLANTKGEFLGHDYNIDHYRTPRTCPGLYVDRNKGDRIIGRVAAVIFVLLLIGMAAQQI